eukprot:scaffold56631_cov23-Cyclotella_meneghiniana.AAC.1
MNPTEKAGGPDHHLAGASYLIMLLTSDDHDEAEIANCMSRHELWELKLGGTNCSCKAES